MSAIENKSVLPPLVSVTESAESDFFLRPGPGKAGQGASLFRRILVFTDQFWRLALRQIAATAERFIPEECLRDTELTRRARLVSRFGVLGSVFGAAFGFFYALVGHGWGVGIVTVCTMGFALIPWLMRRTRSIPLAGNSLCGILIVGFTALCGCEGGSNGHAIAWLVSVPLCALLLVGRKAAGTWAMLSFAAGAGVVAANMLGVEMKPTYDMRWHPMINAAGYLALIVFMFLLGVIFESGRERAFSKMRDANARLASSNEELARLNQEKNEFLGIAAHDLKNPLTVVIGSAELIKGGLAKEQSARMAGNIVGAGQRMLRLIKDLLDANAIEQGRFTSNIERCDMRSIAAECAANNLTSATRKEISIQAEGGEPMWARADRNATMQILDNLISNAVKFSPLKTTVLVRAFADGDFISVAVRDQGPGISEDDQKKLFGKFTRLTAQPTGGESSTGLGLSIVKKLAEAMAGTVCCKSVLGAGSTFILRLPVWREVLENARGAEVSGNPAGNKLPAALDRDSAEISPAFKLEKDVASSER